MNLADKKILITGGAGFVGSILAKYIVENCHATVTILDDLFTGRLEHISNLEVRFVKGSVTETNLITDLVKQSDIIFHLAARNIVASSRSPVDDYEVNIGGTLKLLLEAKKQGIERFVYISTSSIYGDLKHIPVAEDDDLSFLSLYSVSKYAGERYCKVFHELYNLPITIIRYSNVYGENQEPENPGVIGSFIYNALTGKDLLIYGSGKQTRDFTYVYDAVRATVLAAIKPRAVPKVYNVGTGRETSVSELAEKVIAMCKSTSSIKHVRERAIDNIWRRAVNIERITSELGWLPEVTLEEGLRRTMQWMEEKHGVK